MKKLCSVLLVFVVLATCFLPINSLAYNINFSLFSADKAAILYSLDTNEVMFEQNANEHKFPASLTKIMTAVVVIDEVQNLDEEIIVKDYFISSLSGTGLTMGNLKTGEKISVRVLLNLMMVCSSADAALALANHVVQGHQLSDIDRFVDLMNAKAKELKMDGTNYTNVHGIHDENHYTTAMDLIRLCKYANNLPNFMDIVDQSRYTVPATNMNPERTITTTNLLIDSTTSRYYKYAKGIKTGFTTPAGRCLASTATKNGYNYMCVILGGDNTTRSEFTDSKNLYEWAFNNFDYRVIAKNTDLITEIPVEMSWETDFVQLYPEKTVSAIIPSDLDASTIDKTKQIVLNEPTVYAPIKKGDILGYVIYNCAGKEVARVNLIANDTVDRNILLFAAKIGEITFKSLWFKVIGGALLIILIVLIINNILYNKKRRKNTKKVKHIRKF